MAWHVFKPTTRGKQSRNYSAKIKLDGWPRSRVFALRVQDKSVAQEKARALVNDFDRESVGMPSLASVRNASKTPIAPHLAAFLADVEGRGRAAGTVRTYRLILGVVCKRCEWTAVADINVHSFTVWRTSAKVSPKYANNALGYVRTFCAWLVKRRVLAFNPLAELEKIRIRQDRGKRYMPTLEELSRFLSTAPAQRAAVYLFTIYTGLRRAELDGLTWGDVDLDSSSPSVRVPGSISKNGKTERLPLRPEVVAALKAYRPALCQPFEWVFRGRVPKSRTVRKDIEAAGLSPRDEYGRRFDLHGLRTTLCTLCNISGVPPQVAMQIMRHSALPLTMKTYNDTSHSPLAASMALLPSIALPSSSLDTLAETHTSKSAQTAVKQGQTGALSGPSCHFLASPEGFASVSAGPVSSVQVASGEVLKMVGTERFELSTSTTRM
jgi:integrase